MANPALNPMPHQDLTVPLDSRVAEDSDHLAQNETHHPVDVLLRLASAAQLDDVRAVLPPQADPVREEALGDDGAVENARAPQLNLGGAGVVAGAGLRVKLG